MYTTMIMPAVNPLGMKNLTFYHQIFKVWVTWFLNFVHCYTPVIVHMYAYSTTSYQHLLPCPFPRSLITATQLHKWFEIIVGQILSILFTSDCEFVSKSLCRDGLCLLAHECQLSFIIFVFFPSAFFAFLKVF